jgi:fibronectin-binding autotransporter adhesin
MRILYYLAVLMFFFTASFTANAQCSTCNYSLSGNGTYTISAGNTYCIRAGITFSGTVNMDGGTLCVMGNYDGGTINSYSGGGTIYNNGTITKSSLSISNNIQFHNYGRLSVSGTFEINTNSLFYNHPSGNLTVNGNLSNNARYNNQGTVTISGEYASNSGSTQNENTGTMSVGLMNINKPFTNSNILNVKGAFNVNGGGTFTNGPNGEVKVGGTYTNNSTTVNNGAISIDGSFVNNSATFTNNKTVTVLGNFTNYGTLTGSSSSCNPFVVYGAVIYNTGSINYNDLCRKSSGPTFTNQYGTVGGSVTYCTCSASVTPLPVVLKSFAADCNGNDVAIDWVTSTEINNAFFTVSRSADAISWETLQVVAGAMNSNQNVSYSVTDLRPLAGTSYYRLHQTDLDGTSEYFSPVSVSCSANSDVASVSVYPNPADEQFTVSIQAVLADSKSVIELYDLTGRQKLAKTISLQAGTNSIMIDRETLGSGTYTVRVVSNGNILGVQKAILR